MNEIKIMTWNVNHRAENGEYFPTFVGKAIADIDADVICLTEFSFCSKSNHGLSAEEFLEQTFTDRGYDYYPKSPTENTANGANEVLIVWRSSLFELDKTSAIYSQICSPSTNVPNFCTVPLKSSDGKTLRVAAVRITMTTELSDYQKQAKLRRNEMSLVYEKIDELTDENESVCILGDFNCYRRNTPITDWNCRVLDLGRKDYTSYLPTGYSFDGDPAKNIPPAALDACIVKNCIVKDYTYNRDFTMLNSFVYSSKKLINIDPPNPDHASFAGTLYLEASL